MPHIHYELHLRRRKRIVLWKLELRGEYAAFERCFFGPLDQSLPCEHVVFVDRAGGYAFWGIGRERLVFFEEALGCGGRHGGGVIPRELWRGVLWMTSIGVLYACGER